MKTFNLTMAIVYGIAGLFLLTSDRVTEGLLCAILAYLYTNTNGSTKA